MSGFEKRNNNNNNVQIYEVNERGWKFQAMTSFKNCNHGPKLGVGGWGANKLQRIVWVSQDVI